MNAESAVSIFAPAKLNLFLHITGRRDDGYHLIDSLFAFADIGDRLDIAPAGDFQFSVTGPFAPAFTAADKSAAPDSGNLCVRAAYGLAGWLNKDMNVHITLHKNLPLAGGLGGGSADAAATLWGLLKYWQIPPAAVKGLDDLLLSLGADVPPCFHCRAARVHGIGERISPLACFPDIPAVLVNCGASCPTGPLFKSLNCAFTAPAPPMPDDPDLDTLLDFLRGRRNDFTVAAIDHAPEIGAVLEALETAEGCRLARLSGSGASCFALFAASAQAENAAAHLTKKHPRWWVRSAVLGNTARY